MSEIHSSKGLSFWTAVIMFIVALLSLAGNYILYKANSAEIERREQTENRAKYTEDRAKWAEERAEREREAREKLERQQDSIRKFMVNYRANLLQIRAASSRLGGAKASQVQDKITQEKIRHLEEDLTIRVMAFVKFLNDWREVHRAIRPLLNGDVDALDAAAKARDVTEIERRSELLQRNVNDKQRVLEEAAKTLQSQ